LVKSDEGVLPPHAYHPSAQSYVHGLWYTGNLLLCLATSLSAATHCRHACTHKTTSLDLLQKPPSPPGDGSFGGNMVLKVPQAMETMRPLCVASSKNLQVYIDVHVLSPLHVLEHTIACKYERLALVLIPACYNVLINARNHCRRRLARACLNDETQSYPDQPPPTAEMCSTPFAVPSNTSQDNLLALVPQLPTPILLPTCKQPACKKACEDLDPLYLCHAFYLDRLASACMLSATLLGLITL